MKRCLFYYPGTVPPEKIAQQSRFAALSKYPTDDVIKTSWGTSDGLKQQLKKNIPGFKFHYRFSCFTYSVRGRPDTAYKPGKRI
jgi:hypothetical protein